MQHLSVSQWIEQYAPIHNPIHKTTLFFDAARNEDLEFVDTQDPLTVWTYIESTDGTFIVNGVSKSNGSGFYVTRVAVEPYSVIVVVFREYCDRCRQLFHKDELAEGLCEACVSDLKEEPDYDLIRKQRIEERIAGDI